MSCVCRDMTSEGGHSTDEICTELYCVRAICWRSCLTMRVRRYATFAETLCRVAAWTKGGLGMSAIADDGR